MRHSYSSLWILLIYFTQSYTFFLKIHKGKQSIIYFGFDQNKNFNAWDYFNAAAFQLPLVLTHAFQNNLSVIMICPINFNISDQLNAQAPLLEGARIALAWLSVYIRFKCQDAKVVLVDLDDQNINLADLFQILSKRSSEVDTSDIFKSHVFHMQDLKKMIYSNDIIVCESLPKRFFHRIIEKKNFISVKKSNKKTAVITGAAGFIGSNLSSFLLRQGYHIIALDSLLCSDDTNIKNLHQDSNFEFFQFDVNNPFTVNIPIDLVVHLASVPSPQYYYSLPIETLMSGLAGTKNCLDLALEKKARFVFASSSEVYGNTTISPQPEEYSGNVSAWGMRSQYDQSKRGGETLCKLYFEKYGLDIRIARIFNTFGPGMRINDGRVVTNFIGSLLQKKPLIIYGDGMQTRSFCYINDTVQALLFLIENQEMTLYDKISQRVFNVGNDQEYSINQIAQKIIEIGKEYLCNVSEIKYMSQFDKTDPKIRRPNLSKLQSFGIYPKVSLDEGLKLTFLHFLATCPF